MNEKLYAASYADNGGIFVVNFQDGTFEKIARNGDECSKVHSLTMYENSLTFTDTGDHSMKVLSLVTGKCTPYLANGKGTRDGKSAHFFPSGVDCQTNNSVYSQLFYGLLKDGNRCFSCG